MKKLSVNLGRGRVWWGYMVLVTAGSPVQALLPDFEQEVLHTMVVTLSTHVQ